MGSDALQRPALHAFPRILLVVAAPVEAQAIMRGLGYAGPAPHPWEVVTLNERFDLALSGIGKVNAAACARGQLGQRRYDLALSVGIGGSLPDPNKIRLHLPLGAVVAADACVYADEGVSTPTGFIECAELGFPIGGALFPGPSIGVESHVVEALRVVVDEVGPVATVSTCSGRDALAIEVARRTGAIVEAMEGAAVCHVARMMGVACGEIRVVSNTTGDRPGQVWKVADALTRLTHLLGRL